MIDNEAVVVTARAPLSGVAQLDTAQIAWENVEFNPTPGVTYVRERWVPSDEFPATTGMDRVVGQLVLDVMIPRGTGTIEGRALAVAIKNRYPAGHSISNGPTTVIVLSSRVEPGFVWDETRYAIPVSIFIRSEATRN